MTELVNFVLRCTGAEAMVSDADVEDVDNAASRIEDLQDEHAAAGAGADYPLVSRAPKYRGFRGDLVDFVDALVSSFHRAGLLYSDAALMENIQVWVASLSTAAIRAFRHTATVVSLAMVTALCRIAAELASTTAAARKQLAAEERRRGTAANPGRVAVLKAKVSEGSARADAVDALVRDCVDTVFVHRYRDVDPRVRADCIAALGNWIVLHRALFFDGTYLRYLGWVLADPVATTRAVSVAALARLFRQRDNIAGLRAFSDRFRPRLVEMAVRDADADVRAAVVDLLGLVRAGGLLDAPDVDTVGRLVFDTEPRVRRTAGKFFVANIQDLYDAAKESVEDEADDFFGTADGGPDADAEDAGQEDDYNTPRRSWIKFRCLADVLQAYDGRQRPPATAAAAKPSAPDDTDLSLSTPAPSRFTLAAEAVYPHFSELRNWRALVGYLLYDHSQIPAGAPEGEGENDSSGPASAIPPLYRMAEGQEGVLLDVLGCCARLALADLARQARPGGGQHQQQGVKKSRVSTSQIVAQLEAAVDALARAIPQLLNKFGSAPEAATAILRLEPLLDGRADDVASGAGTTKRAALVSAVARPDLLAAISHQFRTHSDPTVLAAAAAALLHSSRAAAAGEDGLGDDAVEADVADLWADSLRALGKLCPTSGGADSLSGYATSPLSTRTLSELSSTLARIANLAAVADCRAVLEETVAPTSKAGQGESGGQSGLTLLVNLAHRATLVPDADDDVDKETANLELAVIRAVFQTLLLYTMWTVQTVTAGGAAPSSSALQSLHELAALHAAVGPTLSTALAAHNPLAPQRLAAVSAYVEMRAVLAALRRWEAEVSDLRRKWRVGEHGDGGDAHRDQEHRDEGDQHRDKDKEHDRIAAAAAAIRPLLAPIPPVVQARLAQTHDAAARAYARLLGRKIELEPLAVAADTGDRGGHAGRESRKHTGPHADDAAPEASDDEEAHSDAAPEASDEEDEDEVVADEKVDEDDVDEQDDGDSAASDPEAESDGHAHSRRRRAARERACLAAERRLCGVAGKVVLGVLGRLFGGSRTGGEDDENDENEEDDRDGSGEARIGDAGMKARLLQNRGRLGRNYRAVVGFVDVTLELQDEDGDGYGYGDTARDRGQANGPEPTSRPTTATAAANTAAGETPAPAGEKTQLELPLHPRARRTQRPSSTVASGDANGARDKGKGKEVEKAKGNGKGKQKQQQQPEDLPLYSDSDLRTRSADDDDGHDDNDDEQEREREQEREHARELAEDPIEDVDDDNDDEHEREDSDGNGDENDDGDLTLGAGEEFEASTPRPRSRRRERDEIEASGDDEDEVMGD